MSPFEALFVKTNRNMISERELASYTFTSLAKNYNEGNLTKEGVNLFEKSSNLLAEKEGVKITAEQLISILKSVKRSSPKFAEDLRRYL